MVQQRKSAVNKYILLEKLLKYGINIANIKYSLV